MEKRGIRRLIGSRAFYAMVFSIVLPMIVQNSISNFVSLLDNLMVGHVGTEQMSGVAIANQLLFIINIAVYGAVAGAGIFSAQFHGAKDTEGVRNAFRFKLIIGLSLSALSIVLFLCAGKPLISLYLNESDNPLRVQQTLAYGLDYLRTMQLGIVPFALTQAYASTLRETGQTRLPMLASIAAMLVNLVFNYLLIFGKMGFPYLGVRGAAIATVIARFVELAITVIYVHAHPANYPFAHGVYRTLRIPSKLARSITVKALPLMANELLWSVCLAFQTQIYSLRGLDVIAAINISNTVFNLFSVVFLSLGNATAIIVGQELGANRIDEAREDAWKMLFFSVTASALVGCALAALSGAIPLLYNTSDAVHRLASRFICVCALLMPANAFVNCTYFVLRSGGKTGITFLFDCGFSWVICIPIAFVLAHWTKLEIVELYFFVQLTDVIKSAIGFLLVKKGFWIHNIVSGKPAQNPAS